MRGSRLPAQHPSCRFVFTGSQKKSCSRSGWRGWGVGWTGWLKPGSASRGWTAFLYKQYQQRSNQRRMVRFPSSHLSSRELSEESGPSVQHGASSIPPAGCLGPVWMGCPDNCPHQPRRTPSFQGRPVHATVPASGSMSASLRDCGINICRAGSFAYVCMDDGILQRPHSSAAGIFPLTPWRCRPKSGWPHAGTVWRWCKGAAALNFLWTSTASPPNHIWSPLWSRNSPLALSWDSASRERVWWNHFLWLVLWMKWEGMASDHKHWRDVVKEFQLDREKKGGTFFCKQFSALDLVAFGAQVL